MLNPIYYRNSLILVLIISCLPITLIAIFFYKFGLAKIEEEVKHTHQVHIARTSERINDIYNQLEILASTWSMNPSFDYRLESLDLQRDVSAVQDLYRTITIMKSSNYLIEDVVLFINKQKVLISDTTGIVKILDTEELKRYQTLLTSREFEWTDQLLDLKKGRRSSLALVSRLPGSLFDGYGSLIIYLNEDKVNKLTAELEPDDRGSSLLLREDGRIISARQEQFGAQSDLDAEMIKLASQKENIGRSFIFNWDNHRYSVSTGELKRIGQKWRYVTATPIEKLTAPVVLLSRLILTVSGIMLLAAGILSWLTSRMLYRPIQGLLKLFRPVKGRAAVGSDEFDIIAQEWQNLSRESHLLQTKLDQHLPTLRKGFLLQLAQGHLYTLNETELMERLVEYGWDVGDKRIVVVLFELHGFANSSGKFTEGDDQLVSFAAVNVTEELARTYLSPVEIINFHNLTIGALIPFDTDVADEKMKADVFHFSSHIIQTLQHLLHAYVTICIGKPTASLREVPDIFYSASHALKYKDLNEPYQIIDMEEVMPNGDLDKQYPFAQEKELIQALRMGLEEEADLLLEQFYEQLQKQVKTEIHIRQGMIQLLGNIQNAMLQTGFNPMQFSEGTLLSEQFVAMRDPDTMLKWLKHKVISPYLEELVRTRNSHLRQLVEQVLDTVHENYMKDISLESCADLHGTYPKKLSVAFKQVTGINFIDYLTQYRLEKAKHLLRENDETVNEIAEQVGYQPPYFHRLFKKHEGLTPGQYREQYRH